MQILPLGSRLIVRKKEIRRYKGLIEVPENSRQRMMVFEVVKVGPGVTIDLKEGDLVLISFYTGLFVDIVADIVPEDLRSIEQDEIIARVIED